MPSPLPYATCPVANEEILQTWIATLQPTNGEFLSCHMALYEWRVFLEF